MCVYVEGYFAKNVLVVSVCLHIHTTCSTVLRILRCDWCLSHHHWSCIGNQSSEVSDVYMYTLNSNWCE